MKTPFDLISEIQTSKKRYILETDDSFVPFVIQKGLSMQSPAVCSLLAATTNHLYDGLDNQMWMDLLKLLIPRSNGYHKWITKKDKDKKTKDSEMNEKIKKLALVLERSIKEIKMMIELDPSFMEQFEEIKESIKQKKSS